MKNKLVVIALFCAFGLNAQFSKIKSLGNKVETNSGSKAQTYIDGANASIKKLEEKLESANWENSSFERGYISELENLDGKIKSIKRDDPNYKIKDIEDKYVYFVNKKDEASKKTKDDKATAKTNKENEQKKAETDRISALLIKDEGITNAIHEKNLQKMMFASVEIPRDNPSTSQFGTEFPIVSPIYFRFYLKNSIYNEIQKDESSAIFDTHLGIACKIYIDGIKAYEGPMAVKSDGKEFLKPADRKVLTSISGAFNFNDDKLGSRAYINALITQQSKLMPGKHSVKVELYPTYKSTKPATELPMATGEFVLNITSGFVNPTNTIICMPKAVKKDAAMETKYKECVKKYLINNEKDAVLKSFVLLSTEWEIRKDDITSVPISKTMYGAAGLSYKDGRCKYETFSFTQNWNGNAYGATVETSSTNQDGDIFCDCFK